MHSRRILVALIIVLLTGLSGAEPFARRPAIAVSPETERVSVASDGSEGNGDSLFGTISADNRYVPFYSHASNLVPGDTNGATDTFVHDRQTGATERVSVASDGSEGNGDSLEASSSEDGRYVAFYSYASNLVLGDTNTARDVFVHDRQTGETERVSVASDGSEGNGDSQFGTISADGRFIAFYSGASNLVPGDTNGARDVFVHDRQTGATERVSVASDGSEGNGDSLFGNISAEGRYVAFQSGASNLVPGDANGAGDSFVHDRQTGATERVSVASDGSEGNGQSNLGSVSVDGRYVAFQSGASNLVPGDTNGSTDIFVHDRQTGATERVSVASDGSGGNSDSYVGIISADDRYVAFGSYASNLVPGDTNGVRDSFVHDRQTGATERVSVASDGSEGNGDSYIPVISTDGRYVAFYSYASNLVAGDTNGFGDVFVHDRGVVPPVGGVAGLPRLDGGQAEVAGAPRQVGGGSSGPNAGVLAGIAAAVAAGAAALGGAAWRVWKRPR